MDMQFFKSEEERVEITRTDSVDLLSLSTDSRQTGIIPAFTFPLTDVLELLIRTSLSREHADQRQGDADSTITRKAILTRYEAAPGIGWSAARRGRLKMEAVFIHLHSQGPWSQISSLFRRSDEEGTEIKVTVSGMYKLQKSLTMNIDVSYGTTPSRKSVIEGAMELAAYF